MWFSANPCEYLWTQVIGPTCAYTLWALMHRFLSVCVWPAVCDRTKTQTGPFWKVTINRPKLIWEKSRSICLLTPEHLGRAQTVHEPDHTSTTNGSWRVIFECVDPGKNPTLASYGFWDLSSYSYFSVVSSYSGFLLNITDVNNNDSQNQPLVIMVMNSLALFLLQLSHWLTCTKGVH